MWVRPRLAPGGPAQSRRPISDERQIFTVAIERSRARWIVGALPLRETVIAVRACSGGNTERLIELLLVLWTPR